MKKTLCCFAVLLGLSWAMAQTGGSSSSGSQAAGSSAQSGSTDQETKKETKKGAKKGGGETTLTGCLSGPNDEGVYVLQHGAKKAEVGGNDDLSKHVGHTVKLHGMWAKGSDIGEKESGEKGGAKEEKGERHFKVTSIDHVAEGCKGAAAGGEGHHHKKGSSSDSSGTSQPSTPPK
jgi:hypothetical protein